MALVFATDSTETTDAQIANANKDLLKYKTIPFYQIIRKYYKIYNLTD
ncbi:hypothetical protein SARI_01311 [Salmonella enterica subsp. arizonae serovar 62:z4,z23:-]|uniref:Uncharacterized protein n=1 Tax=Salmonella arizonae (strain ATCC BAA-731 / CDC346-86 / RSK2980) TaxID=41514 RepID=A9MQ69_SALAR|nr:hypothetical protein SARI_01311 [Salmonella enterica subsp. arizonae serovar 62:z4,z23:-]